MNGQRVEGDYSCKTGGQGSLDWEFDCAMPGKSTGCTDVGKDVRQVSMVTLVGIG